MTRTLARYHGIFWDYTKGTGRYDRGLIRVYSPEEAAKALGCEVGAVTYHPLSELYIHAKAHAFMNILAANGHLASPLTRRNLTDRYNVSARAQRYYSRYLGIVETPNYTVEAICQSYQEAMDEVKKRGGYGKYKAIEGPIHDSERLVFQGALLLRQIGNSRPTDIYSGSGSLVRIGESRGEGIWATGQLGHILQAHRYFSTVPVGCEVPEHPVPADPECTEGFIETLCGLLAEGGAGLDGVIRSTRTQAIDPVVPYCHEVHVQPQQNKSGNNWFTVDNFL